MPQASPDFIGLRTPLRHLNESFALAVRLVDDLRALAYQCTGRDGYIAVSDGQYNRCPMWDPRDYDHISKMTAYLWGMEPHLDEAVSDNVFGEQLDAVDGHLMCVYRRDQRGIHVGQFAKYAAERFRYGADADHLRRHWPQAQAFVRWAFRAYDALGTGLIDQISADATGDGFLQTFWGFFIGEPEHFPHNLSPYSKPLGASMTCCALLEAMATFGEARDLPGASEMRQRANALSERLEDEAYSERRGYYYLQHDAFNRQWYFSVNGECEDSRELFIIPYYADEVCRIPERQRSVARVVEHVLRDRHVFPLPITYPFYRWYGASSACHFHAFGMDRFLLGGCWDSPYAASVALLGRAGLIDTVVDAVRRRSEAIVRDGDCLEWYYPDGSTGENGAGTSYHRDRYGISATAHIASVIEGLFGIRPLAPGFSEIAIAPAFPYRRDQARWAELRQARTGSAPFTGWRHSAANSWLDREVGVSLTLPGARRLDWDCYRDTEANLIRLRCSAVGARAHYRLPLEDETEVVSVQQGGVPLPFGVRRDMDTRFVRFSCLLDGRDIVVQLRPLDGLL